MRKTSTTCSIACSAFSASCCIELDARGEALYGGGVSLVDISVLPVMSCNSSSASAAAASFTASAEIFGEKDTAGARWIAGDFTKYAPAETIIEPWCLKADRVKNTR